VAKRESIRVRGKFQRDARVDKSEGGPKAQSREMFLALLRNSVASQPATPSCLGKLVGLVRFVVVEEDCGVDGLCVDALG